MNKNHANNKKHTFNLNFIITISITIANNKYVKEFNQQNTRKAL